MISLTQNQELILSVLEDFSSDGFIKGSIRMYLASYGVEYDFSQYYVQYSDDSNLPVSLILRYNQSIYTLVGENADISELSSFLRGFSDYELFSYCHIFSADATLSRILVCYEMAKAGDGSFASVPVQRVSDVSLIAELVTSDLSSEKRVDFFLNTSHMLRHNTLNAFGYSVDGDMAAVAAVSAEFEVVSVIPFVHTKEYFRGNGYGKQLLLSMCNNPDIRYCLICEEHNIPFYEKSGFIKQKEIFKYSL